MNRSFRNSLGSAVLVTVFVMVAFTVWLWLAASLQTSVAGTQSLSNSRKDVAPSFVQPGEIVTYTIVLSNSSAISDVTAFVTDPLHPLLSYVPGSDQAIPENGGTLFIGDGITWTVTISPAAAVTLTFQAVVSPDAADGTIITNTASISSDGSLVQQSAAVTVDLPPTSQIWSPDRDAIITEKDSLTVSGFAWDYGTVPPFIVGDPVLGTQRVDDRSYYVSWTAVISAEQYILQEATTPDFSAIEPTVVPAPALNYLISKDTGSDGTYYYRVRASRFGLEPSRWSNVESVTVPWTTSGSSSMSALSSALADSNPVTVEVRIDDAEWHTVPLTATDWVGGWSWSYDWLPLPQDENVQHTIQTRATDAVGNVGPVDVVTITLDNKAFLVYMPFIATRWPPVPYAPTLFDISNSDNDGNYNVYWTYDAGDPPVNVDSYTLQEATDADFTYATSYDTTSTSRTVSGKSPAIYYYRVRGNNSYGAGYWSETRSVSVLPGTPTLNPIDNPNKSASYTISWSEARDAASYTLEESTTSDFASASVIYSGSARSFQVTGRSSGTYYYRVKAVFQSVSSPWSNIVSTAVEAGFYDNFSSTGTGWPQTTYDRGTSPDGPVMTVGYTGGTYRMKILLNTVGLNNKRMGIVPSPYVNSFTNYNVEVDHYFAQTADQTVDPTWGKAGLIFGASSDFRTIFMVEWHFPSGSDAPQCAVYKYNQVSLPTSIVWQAGGTPLWGWAVCPGLKGGYNQANRIRVDVRGNQATVYINSTKLGTFNQSDLGGYHRVGLMTGSWERTPVESRFDNFRVTPQ